MIEKFGLAILFISILIGVFTSNIFISENEKKLSDNYSKKIDLTKEAKYAYANVKISRTIKFLGILGFLLILSGKLLDGN